jgi:hypothetical protein
MSRIPRLTACGVLVALLLPMAGWAQFNSELVGFNDNPDDPASEEMFQGPLTSGTTDQYIVPGDPNSGAFRSSEFPTEGVAALNVFYDWLDPADPNAWVRVTTFNADVRPNPALHTSGKVRFNLVNVGNFAAGEVGIAIGIRETGNAVAMLSDGGTSGQIWWAGVDTTVNGIIAGADGIVDTAAMGDDVQLLPVGTDINDPNAELPDGTTAIGPGGNGIIDTTPANDDETRFGYFINDLGARVPIPATTLPIAISPYALEWDLTTGVVSVNGSPVPNSGRAGFTSNDVFVETYGTLEHVALTNVTSDAGSRISVHIDELQFEAPVPDPVTPPTVVSPIIAGDTEVTVKDLVGTVDRVTLYRNGGSPIQITSGLPAESVTFNIAPPAQTGEIFTATQRSSQAGDVSGPSLGVEVLPEPPTFTFSLIVDEGGTGSCVAFVPPGWEWVGVTAPVVAYEPQGQALFNDPAVWQTVDIPLDDPDLIEPSFAGNGDLAPAPEGIYTIDTLWFSAVDPAEVVNPDPNIPLYWEVYIDAVQLIDAGGQPAEIILDMEDGVNRMTGIRGQSPDSNVLINGLSSNAVYDGAASHRLVWAYDGEGSESIGLLQRAGSCGTAAEIPDTTTAIRFRLHTRAMPLETDAPLPSVVGPIVVGTQDTVRVETDPNATGVQLFINGAPASGVVAPMGGMADFAGLTLFVGDSISATQMLPVYGESGYAYPKAATNRIPPPAILGLPIPGDSEVTVGSLLTAPYASASLVTLIVRDDQGTLITTFDATPDDATVVVATSVLQSGWFLTATQTVNGIVSPESAPIPVELASPVIHHPPAASDTEIKLIEVLSGADVTVTVRDDLGQVVGTFTAGPHAGGGTEIVTVSGLVAGYSVTAMQTLTGIDSVESDPEPVTVDAVMPYFDDDFEAYANQDDYENEFDTFGNPVTRDVGWWPSSGDPGLLLTTDEFFGGASGQAVFAPAGTSDPNVGTNAGWQSNYDITYRETAIDAVEATTTDVISWSVAIYDDGGSGANNMFQWAELREYYGGTGSGLDGLIAVGMPGSYFFAGVDNNYYQARVLFGCGGNYVNLDQYEAPQRSLGWHLFTVIIKTTDVDEGIGEVNFYVDGKLAGKTCRDVIAYDNLYVGSGYAPGVRGWFDEFSVTTGKAVFPTIPPLHPIPPAIEPPVQAGDATVTVSRIGADVTNVQVFAEGALIGQIDPMGADTVEVPVTPLVHLDDLTATQTNANGVSRAAELIEVGIGNGDVLISLGVRETNSDGTLGLPGGTSGPLEWIGAASELNGAPQGKPITPMNTWQTVVFDSQTDPITGFPSSGDGAIDANEPFGTIEHLAVAVNAASADRSSGGYRLFVDNVINVGADGGADFVVSDFETYPLGGQVLFQQPGFSGSTDFLLVGPNFSVTSDIYGNPDQSQYLGWFWIDTEDSSWVRITTTSTPNVNSPIVDLTKPIQMDILLVKDCSSKGDLDSDGDVDFDDFTAFLTCLAGVDVPTDPSCTCSDFNNDGRVDVSDLAGFQAAFTD